MNSTKKSTTAGRSPARFHPIATATRAALALSITSALALAACSSPDAESPHPPRTPVVVTAITYPGVRSLAADDASLYFEIDTNLFEMPRDGGPRALLFTADAESRGLEIVGRVKPGLLVAETDSDSSALRLISFSGALSSHRVGSTPTQAVTATADDDRAFWADYSGAISTVPFASGTTTKVRDGGSGPIEAMVADGDSLYFTNQLAISRMLKVGGDVAEVTSTSAVRWLRVSGPNVYWIEMSPSQKCGDGISVKSAPKVGGAAVGVFTFDGCPSGFEVDDDHAYVLLSGSAAGAGWVDGSIVMANKAGGAAKTIVGGIPNAHALAVAKGAAFWVQGTTANHEYNGAIMKIDLTQFAVAKP